MSDVAHIEAARRDYKNTLELIHRVMPAASGVVLGALSQLIKQRDEANARLAAAESRLREYEDAPTELHKRVFSNGQIDWPLRKATPEITEMHESVGKTFVDYELIIRPRGGKGE